MSTNIFKHLLHFTNILESNKKIPVSKCWSKKRSEIFKEGAIQYLFKYS